MTKWKSLGKNGKKGEHTKKWFCKHPQAEWIVQMFLEASDETGK